MFYEQKHEGHAKYVLAGVFVGVGLSVGVYYALQYKLDQKLKSLAEKAVKDAGNLYNEVKDKLVHETEKVSDKPVHVK